MLDPLGRKEIIGIVRRLNEEKGITVIMITQYMEEAVGCERVIVINDGSIVMDGTPEAVFARGGELRAIGLDVPPSVELRELLKKKGIADCGSAMTIEDLTDKLCLSLSKT